MDEIKINREVKADTVSAAPSGPRKHSRITKKEIWLIVGSIVLITAGYFTYQALAGATIGVSLQVNQNFENGLVTYFTFDDAAPVSGAVADDSGNQNSAFGTSTGPTPFTSIGTTTYTVPAGVNFLSVKAWGGGGGSGVGENLTCIGGDGGGGAFAQSVVPVTPGESLNVVVGGGGAAPSASSKRSGGGGGMTTLRRGNTDLLIAAGGGGGGGCETSYNAGDGGPGGAFTGGDGTNGNAVDGTGGFGGGGATNLAGGALGAGDNDGGTAGTAGTALAGGGGGTGAGAAGGVPGGGTGGSNGEPDGGGGGGGYFGGGGGGQSTSLNGGSGGGGGGGASYSSTVYTSLMAGSSLNVGNKTDLDYAGGSGMGGVGVTGTTGNAGTAGRMVLASTSPLTLTAGRIGQGIQFGGTNATSLLVQATSSVTGTYTIAAWVKPLQTAASNNTFFGSRGPSDNGFDVKFSTGGIIHADIGNGSSWLTTNADATINWTPNTWYHIAYVVTQTGYTIYVNGSNVGSGSYTSDVPVLLNSTHKLVLGAAGQSSNLALEYFTGVLDDVRIYNRALSAAEVLRLEQVGATTKISTTVQTNPGLQNGLVAYWPMDGAYMISNMGDASGNGNNGYLEFATSTGPGKFGQAIKFGGIDTGQPVVDVPNTSSLQNNQTMSIAFWIKGGATTTLNDYGSFFSKDDSRPPGWRIQNIINADDLYMRIDTTACSNCGSFGRLRGALNGAWHHVAFTIDASQSTGVLQGYLDGALVDANSTFASGTGIDNGSPFHIKQNNQSKYTSVDDLRIYNRVLSTSEVQRLYQMGSSTIISTTVNSNPNQSSSLVGYWSFDGKDTNWTAGTVSDKGSGGNAGQMINMSTSTTPTMGKMGQALLFNGSTQYLNMGNVNNFTTDYHITLAAWVKTTATAEGIVVAKFNNASPFNGWELDVNYVAAGTVSFQMANTCSGNANCLISRTSGTTVNDGRWHFIAATNDGTGTIAGTKIYIDGVSQAVTSVSNTLSGSITNSTPMEIGARGSGSSASASLPCACAIDDVRVYNRTLSGQEILRLYHIGK